MIITYFQQHKTGILNERINSKGFICPYNKENCMHMDSLSMTRTVNCNDCGINIKGNKIDNRLNISDRMSNMN